MSPMPRILAPTNDAISLAAERLRAGDVIAFPTETVYGLGAATFNATALERIFALKGRPFDNPLIAHVLDETMARERLSLAWDNRCTALAARFWPGPLTIIVPKRAEVPKRATAGLDTIAIRSPDHPVARELLRAFGAPISAPSANRSGHVSPTSAQHVASDFADVDDLIILDGGPCRIGIESTVLDMTADLAVILRPGSITLSDIADVIGEVRVQESRTQDASPGTSPRHYAPRTPARLLSAHDIRNEIMAVRGRPCAVLAVSRGLANAVRNRPEVTLFELPADPAGYGEHLYSALRRADEASLSIILIERPAKDVDAEPRWTAILDRLQRATAGP